MEPDVKARAKALTNASAAPADGQAPPAVIRLTHKKIIVATVIAGAAVLVLLLAGGGSTVLPEPAIVDTGARMSLPRPYRSAAATASHVAQAVSAVLAASTPARALGPDEAELCGVGVVSKLQVEQPSFLATMERPWVQGRRALAKQLLGGNDEAQALGLWMSANAALEPVVQPLQSDESACNGDETCLAGVAARNERALMARQPLLDRLADFALSTRRPGVYAIAMQACRGSQGRCALLGTQQWTQIDPDNAVPWLFAAEAAGSRNDSAARTDALYHASIAHTSRIYGDSLLAMAEPSIDALPNEAERVFAGLEVVGMQAAWSFPSYRVVIDACSAQELLDSNRRQLCDGLATMLLQRSRMMLERGMGSRLADRLGWPEDRLANARLEVDAYAALRQEGVGPAGPAYIDTFACPAMRQGLDRELRRSHDGEVESARMALLASGLPLADLAAQGAALREAGRQASARRREAAAASAARAAS